MVSEAKRSKFKGRGKGPPFLMLEHRVTDSLEFGELSGNAVKMLLEACRQYRPGKNGDISLPWSMLSERGWRSPATAHKAKQELLAGGWLVKTRQGGKHLANLYAVTLWPINASEKHAEPEAIVPLNLWKRPLREAA